MVVASVKKGKPELRKKGEYLATDLHRRDTRRDDRAGTQVTTEKFAECQGSLAREWYQKTQTGSFTTCRSLLVVQLPSRKKHQRMS